jgi:membrane-associated phospholipid phosphatase
MTTTREYSEGRERERGREGDAPPSVAETADRRAVLAPPVVALLTLVAALIATDAADVRFRDPDNVAAVYLVLVGAGVAGLIGLDIWWRAARLAGTWRVSRALMTGVRQERWTTGRLIAVASALVSFYVTYLAYRNLKGVIPLLRPGELFDSELAALDRAVFVGNDPAALLHDLLGTGVAAHALSGIYVAFIVFLPLSLGVALVFARDLPTTLFYATAMSVNWVLGAVSYFIWPALGPIYVYVGWFAELPHSEVTRLQQLLLDDRIAWLRDPTDTTPQAIAAFASLHIAMSFTAVLAAHMLGLSRRMKIALWVWLAGTALSTIYLGWHYVVDDVAGLLIGAAALWLAKLLTGFDVAAARVRQRAG